MARSGDLVGHIYSEVGPFPSTQASLLLRQLHTCTSSPSAASDPPHASNHAKQAEARPEPFAPLDGGLERTECVCGWPIDPSPRRQQKDGGLCPEAHPPPAHPARVVESAGTYLLPASCAPLCSAVVGAQ